MKDAIARLLTLVRQAEIAVNQDGGVAFDIVREIRRCATDIKFFHMQEQRSNHLFVLTVSALIPVAFCAGFVLAMRAHG